MRNAIFVLFSVVLSINVLSVVAAAQTKTHDGKYIYSVTFSGGAQKVPGYSASELTLYFQISPDGSKDDYYENSNDSAFQQNGKSNKIYAFPYNKESLGDLIKIQKLMPNRIIRGFPIRRDADYVPLVWADDNDTRVDGATFINASGQEVMWATYISKSLLKAIHPIDKKSRCKKFLTMKTTLNREKP